MAVEKEVRLVVGFPAAGKTTYTQQYVDKGYTRLNRDTIGGTVDGLILQKLGAILQDTDNIVPGVVMDNTYVNTAARAQTIALCKRHGVTINCTLINTSIEDAQVNFCMRMIQKHGRILQPHEITKSKDPSMLPTAALFGYRKNFEKPTEAEGFAQVEIIKFIRKTDPDYRQKALLLDYDGCLRKTKSGGKYPIHPSDIEILPGRKEVLKQFFLKGWYLCGISNQSGVAKGDLTYDMALACFEKTNDLLEMPQISVGFCPHSVPPINCYCRKPMCGLAVYWIEKHKLDRSNTVLVGDMKTDETCAKRAGVHFCDSEIFFNGKWKEILK